MRATCSNRTEIQNTNSAQRRCAHNENIYIWVLSSIAEKTSKHKTVLTVLLQNKGLPVNSAHQRFPHVELSCSSKPSLPLHFSSIQLLHGNSATVERSSGGDAIDLSRDLRSSHRQTQKSTQRRLFVSHARSVPSPTPRASDVQTLESHSGQSLREGASGRRLSLRRTASSPSYKRRSTTFDWPS